MQSNIGILNNETKDTRNQQLVIERDIMLLQDEIKKLINDTYLNFHPIDFSGALVVMENEGTAEDRELAARIAVRYSKGKNEEEVKVRYGFYGQKHNKEMNVSPVADKELEEYLVNVK